MFYKLHLKHLVFRSFEARIYAEDPDNNFMPGAGPLKHLSMPEPIKDQVLTFFGSLSAEFI